MFRCLTAIALVIVCGCSSLVVISPPAERPRAQQVGCTDTYMPPIVDTALTLVTAAASMYILRDPDQCGGLDCFLGAVGVVATPVIGVTAAIGYSKVHACKRTKAEIQKEIELARTNQAFAW